MTKRNSSQRVQDVIDRLSDLNVRELAELQRRLSYDRENRVLAGVLLDILNNPAPLEIDPSEIKPERESEDELPIIRAARENGIAP